MSLEFTVESTPDPLPEGFYPVRLTEVKPYDTPYGVRLRLLFEVAAEGPHQGETVAGWCSKPESFNSWTKLYKWSTVLLGGELPEGARFSVDDIIGAQAVAMVELVEDKEGNERNNIVKLSAWASDEESSDG